MKNFKRFSITTLTAIYFVVDVFGSLLIMGPAKASPVSVVTDVPATVTDVRKESKLTITKILTMSAMGVLINAVSYFARKISHDTAVYIASGGKGQGALIFKDGVGEYMKNTALDTVGEAVGTLGEPFGLNLCQIPNPKLDINLRINYRNMFPTGQEPKPKCTWKELEGSWGNIGNIMEKRYGPGGGRFVSETFNANLSVSQSDFGIALDAMGQLDNIHAEAKAVAQLERTFTQGIKSVVSPISGRTMTPAASIQREIEGMSAAEQSQKTEGQIAGMYASQLENLPGMAASVFLNTLVSTLLQNIMSGMFSDTPDSKSSNMGSLASGLTSFFASAPQLNKKNTERVFSFLTTPTITQVDDYKTIDQLFVAKAVDPGMQQAVNRGNNLENMLTIGEAMELNYLHREWPLIPPTHAWNNSVNKDCYQKGYCYSNLQKLRKARIIPVGFELAALKSSADTPWTLGKVVDGFDDCNQFGEADSKHPYCHLIDPNWVLKAPEARCKMEAVGPELIQEGINKRATECMDLETCISRADNGTCNYWGYCTKEENIWRLAGESCPDYYNTCTSYRNTATNQASSYLSRTLDYGQCDIKSIGCQAYSSEQSKASGAWQWETALSANGAYKVYGRNQVLYFNRNVETCPANFEGCSAFYGAQRDSNTGLFNKNNNKYIRDSANLIHLKKAPDYLNCYDTVTLNSLGTDWPKNKTEVLTQIAGNDSRCNEFAQVCAPEEVGCSRFTPTAGGSTVTAIVDTNNTCPKECVGYASFKQESSNFEGEKFPVHFIPSFGKTCSVQSVGCSEFTNLSSSAGGESLVYYSDVRLCEKPDKIEEKAFFSWEGSESEGYVLRSHLLKTINAAANTYISGLGLTYSGSDNLALVFPVDSPAYGDTTRVSLQDSYTSCNATSYALLINNPFAAGAANGDCRQLYDDTGRIFYRILRRTVVIDESCQRLRKSDTNLFTDTNITTQGSCQAQGGYWDTNAPASCKRCYGGGVYQGNTCIYEALPSESASCTATDNGCRAYTGNAGNNVRPGIISDIFEGDPSTAIAHWETAANISQAAESLQTGQHSLKVINSPVYRVIDVGTSGNGKSLEENGWYEISFWVRGAPQNLNISFFQGVNRRSLWSSTQTDIVTISVSNNWQEYRLGPVQFTGDSSAFTSVRFDRSGTGSYYIDNFSIAKIEDNIYLVKDSWKQLVEFNGNFILADAPLACYMGVAPGGNFPGAALGCREYKDESSNIYYLTSFSSLCREAAIGCQPMFESNNTVGEVLATVYNLICTPPAGTVGDCTVNIFGTTGSCYVAQGETGCYIPKIVLPTHLVAGQTEYTILNDLDSITNVDFDVSTVYIPPENANPVYLANVEQHQCGAEYRGCTLLGKQDQTVPSSDLSSFDYSDTYILNNPEQYEDTLCRQDLIGCNEYVAGAGTYYFKDPTKNNSTCSYKDNVDGFSGWFKDGIGNCSNDDTILCQKDENCGTGNTCLNIGILPCYPDYLENDTYYNIWSNKSSSYEGLAGVCEQSSNGCTEIIDPQDTTALNPDGKPYYRIFDANLTAGVADCEGQVSLKEGCVLFDRTDQPNKLYNTQATYAASDSADPRYSLVNPVSSSQASAPNNANVILKVKRDRECSEWLTCTNLSYVTDSSGKKKARCSSYQACDRLTGGQHGTREGCGNVVKPAAGETYLDDQKYATRDVSWYGFDYSGYSILNKHQIGSYEYLALSDSDEKQYLGVSVEMPSYATNECVLQSGGDTTGLTCGTGSQGRCYGSNCIYTLDGKPFPDLTAADIPVGTDSEATLLAKRNSRLAKMRQALLSPTCKAYPEDTAPFPKSIAAEEKSTQDITSDQGQGQYSEEKTNINQKRTDFVILNDKLSGVNVCQTNEQDCSCGYKKYTYGDSNIVDYYSATNKDFGAYVPKGVCIGGDKAGVPCAKDTDCQAKNLTTGAIESSGSCSKLKQIDTKLGLFGFCLEPDLSRPINGLANYGETQEFACQTWLPIETSASNVDLYNLYSSAGYDPALDAEKNQASGEMYCANSLQGGIVDTSGGINQTDVTAGNYSSDKVSTLFDNKYFAYDCQLNSKYTCITSIGVTTDNRALCSASWVGILSAVFGGMGLVADLGIIITGAIIGAITSPNYKIADYGAAFHHLICNQYPNNETQIRAGVGSDYDGYLISLQSDIYKSLQAWAWNKIGPNAVVIRAEYGVTDDNGGFAPTNDDPDPSNARVPVREFSSTTDPEEHDNRDGKYVFDNSNQFINEQNIKNIWFIPLNLKGTMRGLVPRQINLLTYSDPLTDDDEYLKLPIAEMRGDNGASVTIDGKPNGSIRPFKSVYIRHFLDAWYPINPLNPDTNNYMNRFDPQRIINWGGTVPDNFVDNQNNRYTYSLDVSERLREGDDTWSTNPFLVWRYKAVNGKDEGYFDTPSNVKTKYVLSWFANDTYQMRYVASKDSNELPLSDTTKHHEYDTNPPKFMGSILSAGGTIDENLTRMPKNGWDNDPFNIGCEVGFASGGKEVDASRQNAWWAVAVNFDNSGNFLGFSTHWCDGLDGGNSNANIGEWDSSKNSHWGTSRGGINYAVIVELETQCTEFVKVTDPSVGMVGTKNKAWTNRVWSNAQGNNNQPLAHPTSDYGYPYSDGAGLLNKNIKMRPFGSTSLDASAGAGTIKESDSMLGYYLENPATDGVPYACSTVLSSGSIGNVNIFDIGGNTRCAFSSKSLYRTTDRTNSYIHNVLGGTTDRKTTLRAEQAISNLFAWFVDRYQINTTGANILTSGNTLSSQDSANISYGKQLANLSGQSDYLLPPRVFSINPATCPAGESGGGNCNAGDADNITVNQMNAIRRVKDYNNDGLDNDDYEQIKRYQAAQGSFDADVRFFAYADDNRMPIRKITVNWGDGTAITNQSTQGYYKNSKPFCSPESSGSIVPLCQMIDSDFGANFTLPSGLTCRTGNDNDCPIELLGSSKKCLSENDLKALSTMTYGAPRFGNIPRACTNAPFEFVHTYNSSCPAGPTRVEVGALPLSDTERDEIMNNFGLQQDDEVCLYKPRVQVMDNWGYCNGSCADIDTDGNGTIEGAEIKGGKYCYSSIAQNAFANNGFDANINRGECEWPDFPTAVPDTANAPYTEYSGYIIVVP